MAKNAAQETPNTPPPRSLDDEIAARERIEGTAAVAAAQAYLHPWADSIPAKVALYREMTETNGDLIVCTRVVSRQLGEGASLPSHLSNGFQSWASRVLGWADAANDAERALVRIRGLTAAECRRSPDHVRMGTFPFAVARIEA
jgi:hypothetical protein